MTHGQQLALEQLREIAAVSDALHIVAVREPVAADAPVVVDVSIDCGVYPRHPEGLPLRGRERMLILVPAGFPFYTPSVATPHTRFAGFPHVQWQRHLCLYQSPATEWDPADGMRGFMCRLHLWLDHGARGQLDPVGAPLHPPVAYVPDGPARLVIPRVNTPEVGAGPWYGLARLQTVGDARADIVGWTPLPGGNPSGGVAAAILLASPMPFEFPQRVDQLFSAMEERDVSRELLILVLQQALLYNEKDAPLYVVIGTPMRGIRGSGDLRQHLTAWYISPDIVDVLRLAIHKYDDDPRIAEIGQRLENIIFDWAKTAPISWCDVREDRPEIVTRRDHLSPLSWFAGRTVAIWGCGAIGGHVAEYVTRAGAARVVLRDKATVTPGVLVRQPYDDQDLGRPKAVALRDRLQRIRPDMVVEAHNANLLTDPLDKADWTDGADILIDATAAEAVLAKLELRCRSSGDRRIPVISMAVGHAADRGLVVLTLPGHSGGPADAIRRCKLEACNDDTFRPFAEEFFIRGRHPVFQPEPGCSDATYLGSAADVAGLAALMLNAAVTVLQAPQGHTATGTFLASPPPHNGGERTYATFHWCPDHVYPDPHSGYEVRVAPAAWAEMEAWGESSRRRAGPKVETGGLLFGERNDALQIVWVTEVSGPPPDSTASAEHFLCGVQGTAELAAEKTQRTGGAVQFIGMWHTHPDKDPIPSATDFQGMATLVAASRSTASRLLLTIIGDPYGEQPTVGAYVFSRNDFVTLREQGYLQRSAAIGIAETHLPAHRIGLTLSGGGSRAIAFHLGCLRALHDRGVLDQLQVLSTVSGGSVIGAMYAYSNGTFAAFEEQVIRTLRSGFVGAIARHVFLSRRLFQIAGTVLIAGGAAVTANSIRRLRSIVGRLWPADSRAAPPSCAWLQPPFRRWFSRTTAFEDALADKLFGTTLLTGERRGSFDVVINATELRTGTAFRFGSRESGCWRYGNIVDNPITVAHAAAASAAYPVFLPALDKIYEFTDRKGNRVARRAILTDGGIYDNHGLSCMDPDRSDEYSCNVFHPEYIICCDAGPGQFDDLPQPYTWSTRMVRSFESVFRRNVTANYQRLHQWRASNAIKGFVLSYLGQQDAKLPVSPPDLVPRDHVVHYPTDFSPMTDHDIACLSARGEQLTRLLLARYCPEL